MMLIDFDWAGREGRAAYPHLRLNSALLDGRVSKDLKITKEDDLRVLTNMLKKLTVLFLCKYIFYLNRSVLSSSEYNFESALKLRLC